MSYLVDREQLESIAVGGCFYGSGGGGTLSSAQHLVAAFGDDYYPVHQVDVVRVEEATAGNAVMVAYMGAPEAIGAARYPLGPVAAAQRVMQRLAQQGRKLAYVAPPESGALGFVVACLVAAKLGLKVIDADGAGRAVPSLPMLTYANAHITPRPAFLAAQSGLQVELDVAPRDGSDGGNTHQRDVSAIVETMMRPIVADQEFGEFGGLAMWVLQPGDIERALPIRGTLSRALKTGDALRAGKLASVAQMCHFLKAEFGIDAVPVCVQGEITGADSDTAGGFDTGTVTIGSGSASVTVVYQNESLLAWDSTRAAPLVMAPDSIAYFLPGGGQQVYSNGDLVAGGKLNPAVRGRSAALLAWRADAALTAPGTPSQESFLQLLVSLGYRGPYVPLPAPGGAA